MHTSHIKNSLAVASFVVASVIVLTPSHAAHAFSYNPNNILSDTVFRNATSLSVTDIQSFLTTKKSGLASMQATIDDTTKSIAQVIADSAQAYQINPKVLLTMMQKEQGVVEDSTLSSYQLNLLMGYKPGSYDASNTALYSPASQIDIAAWQLNRYFQKPTGYSYKVGQETVTQDTVYKVKVKPENQATANLFNYNPIAGNNPGANEKEVGAGGNFLFWKLWIKYFSTRYPDGILVRVKGQKSVSLLKNGKRWEFWSSKVFDAAYRNAPIVEIAQSDLDTYPVGGPVKFPDGTLIRAKTGGVFVITDGMKKPIPSQNALRKLGYTGAPIIDVGDTELKIHPQTTKFDENNLVRQNGALVQVSGKAGIYLIKNGKKQPIWSGAIKAARFPGVPVITISQAELDTYPAGGAVQFPDGTFIRDQDKKLYVISKSKRFLIDNVGVLSDLNMANYPVITVTNAVRDAHRDGGNFSDLQSY